MLMNINPIGSHPGSHLPEKSKLKDTTNADRSTVQRHSMIFHCQKMDDSLTWNHLGPMFVKALVGTMASTSRLKPGAMKRKAS